MMEIYFSKTHEWVAIDGDEATIGITEFAAQELGDITYVELPQDGADVIVGDPVATIETDSASSDVFSPVSGTVYEVNHLLDDDPGIINQSPRKKGWLYRLENIDSIENELDELMDEDAYIDYLETL